MNAFIAFLHHIAFVIIMLTLSAEMLLLKQPLPLASAKKIQRYGTIYGIAAGLILIVGSLRVMYFEKARSTTCTAHPSSNGVSRSSKASSRH